MREDDDLKRATELSLQGRVVIIDGVFKNACLLFSVRNNFFMYLKFGLFQSSTTLFLILCALMMIREMRML